MKRTVVVLDLRDYTGTVLEAANIFEDGDKPEVMRLVNKTIQNLVDQGLGVVRFTREECPVTKTGDGAQVIFESPTHAHDFAVGLHEICAARNSKVSRPMWFRIGVATGEFNDDPIGFPIIWAVRYEGAGKPGWIVIDKATYDGLQMRCQMKYGPQKRIKAKGRDFTVRFSKVVEMASKGGIIDRKELDASKEPFPGEVFAIELLRKPIKIKRENGQVSVTIDRSGVKEMLISNDGKMAKTRQYVGDSSKRKRLETLDREIQSFLAGNMPEREPNFDLNLKDAGICLRWASGGILSIVRYKNREWVPLFFRDIRPYGWNISLGSPERCFKEDILKQPVLKQPPSLEGELQAPWRYMQREFLEESLVFSGTPSKRAKLSLRRFGLPIDEITEAVAKRFDADHRVGREQKDELFIDDQGAETHNEIKVKLLETKCTLKVKSKKDPELIPTKNVLVCFSLLDLGIEVVRVARYDLNDDDYMLDGEIRVRDNPETGKREKELVRMPIALISSEYLSNTFGDSEKLRRYKYTPGPTPSIDVGKGPHYDPSLEKTEIHVFDWDVGRRMAIINGAPGTVWERTRYLDWYDKFNRNFFDAYGRFPRNDSSSLFVPGTAKILNLYFTTVLPDKRGKDE